MLVNNRDVPLDTPLQQGDVILTLDPGAAPAVRMEETEEAAGLVPAEAEAAALPPPAPVEVPPPPPPKPAETPRGIHLILNGTPLTLPEKDSGQPYGLDFDHLEGPVRLTVNGMESGFSQSVRSGDVVTIRCD